MATGPRSSTGYDIFISYKRNVDPDHSLAARVFEVLQQGGHKVFIDRTISVGQEWASEIEAKNVKLTSWLSFVLRLQRQRKVKGGVEIARDQAAKTGKGPKILPVRVAFNGPLPYPLNAWLDKLQYETWGGEGDTDRLSQELMAAVNGASLSLSPIAPVQVPQKQPTSSTPHRSPLARASMSTIPGTSEGTRMTQPWAHLTTGNHVGNKGSRQMGKTSLLVRTRSAAMIR